MGYFVCDAGQGALESLTRRQANHGAGLQGEDPLFEVGNPQYLYTGGGRVTDNKFYLIGNGPLAIATWTNWPVGTTLSTCTQQLFVVWKDACGNNTSYPLKTTYTSTSKKNGPNEVTFTLSK